MDPIGPRRTVILCSQLDTTDHSLGFFFTHNPSAPQKWPPPPGVREWGALYHMLTFPSIPLHYLEFYGRETVSCGNITNMLYYEPVKYRL